MRRILYNKHRPRLVIIGCTGRLGLALVKYYSHFANVIALDRTRLDLSNPASIRGTLTSLHYDRLILASALTDVDYCELHEEEASMINANAPKLISEISAVKKAHMTYISTDYVFDGIQGADYNEHSSTRPLSVYGASKLQGEINVLGVSEMNLVVRLSWIYGIGKPAFPEWIIDQALIKNNIELPQDKISSPSSTIDIVENLDLLLSKDNYSPANGIYHICNSGHCSWQQWGQLCLDQAIALGLPLLTTRINPNCLQDVVNFVAKRPQNTVLNTEKFVNHTGVTPRTWQEAMKEHLQLRFRS